MSHRLQLPGWGLGARGRVTSRWKRVSHPKLPGFTRLCPEHTSFVLTPGVRSPRLFRSRCKEILNFCVFLCPWGWIPSQPSLLEPIGDLRFPLCA